MLTMYMYMHVPDILQATIPSSGKMARYEKTDFLVFLDLISKFTDDIKCLQSKIDIINDKMRNF